MIYVYINIEKNVVQNCDQKCATTYIFPSKDKKTIDNRIKFIVLKHKRWKLIIS